MTGQKSILVSQPSLPPLEEFLPYLEQIWQSRQLTNGGPMHQRLEAELAEYLGVPHVALFNNGTSALLTALQALGITGEVITTPYSFVATAHSLLWNDLTPVFADIEPGTFNIDPERIEAAITPHTAAIMPVHCYGHPCRVERIREIAARHGLPVVYDAAHAFGVNYQGESLLLHGDLAVLSFHATKVFNTFEGGAIVCHDAETKQQVDQLKNFGIVDEVMIEAVGLNGKMNECQAAFGLLQLRHLDSALNRRHKVDDTYRRALAGAEGITCVPAPAGSATNYGYFPILVSDGARCTRDTMYLELKEQGIFARRYFYPLLSDLPMYSVYPSAASANLPNATRVARQVLCLPMHQDLTEADVERIIGAVLGRPGGRR
jgi:dTDP-4-amino-4,6-dideoxygalactose transaminase